jgi:UDP-2,3-diacylglucosamine hydrolase
MKFVAISDVHVKEANDDAEKLLLAFLRNEDVLQSDVIFLLGDIFDLMIGPHSQYFKKFQTIFNEIKSILKKKKMICYVEGNHDFHLRLLFKKFLEINTDIDKTYFKMESSFNFYDSNKKIYFAHGDDVELGNPGYKFFKFVVTSKPLKYVANYLMPYFIIQSIGEYSSSISRKRNNLRYSSESDLTPVFNNFRYSVEEFYKKSPNSIIVLGHSHVKDYYVSKNGFEYINNGYAQHSKTYISIIDGNVGFKQIF